MAIARKCDRCGQLYEVPKAGELAGFTWLLGAGPTFEPGEMEYGKAYDLCPDCTDALSDWMECKTDPEEPKSENVEMFRKIRHAEVEAVEDTRSAFERMSPTEYAQYLQETQPKAEGFVSLLEETEPEQPEQPAEAPQSGSENEGEVVTSRPDRGNTNEEYTRLRLEGKKPKEIAKMFGVSNNTVSTAISTFKKESPERYAEMVKSAKNR